MYGNIKIDGIPLKYADAEFTFYDIKLQEISEANRVKYVLHAHRYYELHFLTNGKYTFSSIDKNVTVNSGEFIIIPPEYKHYVATPSDKFDSIVIQFMLENKTAKNEFYNYFSQSLLSHSFENISASNELLSNVTEFSKCCKSSSGIEATCLKYSLLSNIIYRLFYDINGFCIDGAKAKCCDSKSDFLVILDHMVTSGSYTLKDIAEKTGYSTRNISRLILSIYKMPLMEIKRKNAIYTAKKLLETEKHSIEEVASIAGFKNAAAMRNAFKKYEGATPSIYKNSLNNGEGNNED